jgi:uncharacterized membrane protein YsdA (DUF1294 family)
MEDRPLKLSMSCFSALAEFGSELARVFMLSDSIHALRKCWRVDGVLLLLLKQWDGMAKLWRVPNVYLWVPLFLS